MEKICNKLKAKLQPIETLGFFTSPAASVAASRTKSKAKPGKKTPTPSKSKRGKQAAKPSDTPQRRYSVLGNVFLPLAVRLLSHDYAYHIFYDLK